MAPFQAVAMNVIALTVEYDGTRYHGFQVQSVGPTIQEEIERALARLMGFPVRIVAAGRTDAGVHAIGQVVSFGAPRVMPVNVIQRALNAHLPRDIAVTDVTEKPPEFHARFSAKRRKYRYTICNRTVRPVIGGQFVYHVPKHLEVAAMSEACKYLVGEHDFASFAGTGSGDHPPSTVRTMIRSTCERDGDLVALEFEANAFLPQMVRNLVGTLLLVGTGRLRTDQVTDILCRRDRRFAGQTAPARGLCLTHVTY
ncbi:MAG TPA: tRNA pseudouridine(38-40) synthase TruA [Chloroflexota bacterium]|nr:tRNA pseudouridine(38-40) synthase TruA [Chloroflexota bacterium]